MKHRSTPIPSLHLVKPSTSGEELTLRNLLLAGVLGIVCIWLMEVLGQRISPWDRWAYPVMLLEFGASAAVLTWWPHRAQAVRVATVATFNGYLVLCQVMGLFSNLAPVSLYQTITNLYWLPLGYGTAFVFLSKRSALALSLLMISGIFGPILWCLHVGTAPANWPAELSAILDNVAVAQLVYVVLLLAISQLRLDMRLSREHAEAMQQVAITDPLTGLPNRRGLAEHLAVGTALAQREVQSLSVMLIDVDHFKRVNDTHGHAMGDTVLVALAQVLAPLLRTSDRIGRWGGEEFLVVVPATRLKTAADLGERLRKAVETYGFERGLKLTISVGVAECGMNDTAEQLLLRADTALYAAKQGGRNQVCTSAGLR
ncbi:MAG: diguanylate cyclase [Burkholderiales bacterium]|nr:diguanylate cyclase [Burkholderiales bacterium]